MDEVRRVKPGEAPALFELAREVWTEHYPPIIGADMTEYLLENFHSREIIQSELESGSVRYAAVPEGGGFVAYVGYYPLDGGIFVSKVYVHKNHRKKGYAGALLRHILHENPDIEFLRLYVNRNNVRSIEAYRKLGFKNRGVYKKEIGGGYFYDDYVMQMDRPEFDKILG